jgi:hypothetical protein
MFTMREVDRWMLEELSETVTWALYEFTDPDERLFWINLGGQLAERMFRPEA